MEPVFWQEDGTTKQPDLLKKSKQGLSHEWKTLLDLSEGLIKKRMPTGGFICNKNPFRGLGREEELWAARWHCGVWSYFEKCSRRRISVRECWTGRIPVDEDPRWALSR